MFSLDLWCQRTQECDTCTVPVPGTVLGTVRQSKQGKSTRTLFVLPEVQQRTTGTAMVVLVQHNSPPPDIMEVSTRAGRSIYVHFFMNPYVKKTSRVCFSWF